MLVRFLSYAASVIGARRYKPLLITCLILILSITGITIIAGTLSGDSHDAASQAAQNADKSGENQQSASQLNGLEKKTPKDGSSTQNTAPPASSPGSNGGNSSSRASDQNTPSLDIVLNTATISLSQANPNASVTVAAAGSANNIQWNIVSDAVPNGLSARVENAKEGNAVIRFSNDNAAAGTYQFIISAKDDNRSLSASKTISVTIN